MTKLYIASASFILLTLNIWLIMYKFDCLALIIPILFILIISYSFIEFKMHKRICIRNCYFQTNSLFYKILSSRMMIIIFSVLASIIMGLSAISTVINYAPVIWIYLLVHILLSIIIYKFFSKKFIDIIQPKFRFLLAREWTINITAIIFILVFVYFNFHGYSPSYLDDDLKTTLQNATNSISSQCHYLNMLLKLQIEIESMSWFFIEQTTTNLNNISIKYTIWISFLVWNSFAVLGVNRYIAQIIYLLDKKFNKHKGD